MQRPSRKLSLKECYDILKIDKHADLETLKSISEEFNISEEDLRQANGLRKGEKPNPSEVLYVPDSHDDVVATLLFVRNLQKEELAFAKKGKLLEVHEYVVQEGDTLWGISGKFDLDVDTLVGCNQQVLGGSIHRLKLGMKLRVPNQDGVFVKVAKNDTLGKLADKYGSSSDAVKLANAMKSDKLILGEEIFLPGGKLIADNVVAFDSLKRKIDRETETVLQDLEATLKSLDRENIEHQALERKEQTDLQEMLTEVAAIAEHADKLGHQLADILER